MANKEKKDSPEEFNHLHSSIDDMLLASLKRGEENLQTGRYIVTFKEGADDAALKTLSSSGMRVANALDFKNQDVKFESLADADAIIFPEINVALISGISAQERNMNAMTEIMSDSPIEIIEPEYFAFSESVHNEILNALVPTANASKADYLRGFFKAAEVISKEFIGQPSPALDEELESLVLGNTWGLSVCKVPTSSRSGIGIKVAILDTGVDLGHPDFSGRPIISNTFVGQPVQDLFGHGTHCTGTACGPKAPAGAIPRYGIAYRSSIYIGKVLSNSGSGSSASVLAGMNWAIANKCQIISMSLGSQSPVQAAYTAAGRAVLNNNCLIVAAAGNASAPTGAPANSPTIMAVASLDPNLAPSSFSDYGKIEIAAPGRDVYSTWPRPTKYKTISGTSMATPQVAGCAALWAETSPNLRGALLWKKLQTSAKLLPYPAIKVGAGLVQAPVFI